MKKYFSIFTITLQEYFTYRLNFVMWRVRQIFVFLIPFFIWRAILGGGGAIYGYNFPAIMTYLFGTTILNSMVMGSRTADLGWMINSGYLTIPLMKPLSVFRFLMTRDAADKLFNLIFIMVEVPLLILIFHPPVFLQANFSFILLSIFSTILAIFIYFFINVLFGALAFWSRDIWAPRFLLMVVMSFATGSMFPLDMLPKVWQTVLLATPFPYLLYVPLKLYLGQDPTIVAAFAIQIFWTVALFIATKYVWGRGMRVYEAEGR